MPRSCHSGHSTMALPFKLALVALLTPMALGTATTVSYDTFFDDPSANLTSVACSDGPFGLIPKGYSTLGSLPNFPYIGGSDAIAGWGSSKCGTCWSLTYQGKTIKVLAIDHAASGFNIAMTAMNDLTNGQSAVLGKVNANAVQIAASNCGF